MPLRVIGVLNDPAAFAREIWRRGWHLPAALDKSAPPTRRDFTSSADGRFSIALFTTSSGSTESEPSRRFLNRGVDNALGERFLAAPFITVVMRRADRRTPVTGIRRASLPFCKLSPSRHCRSFVSKIYFFSSLWAPLPLRPGGPVFRAAASARAHLSGASPPYLERLRRPSIDAQRIERAHAQLW